MMTLRDFLELAMDDCYEINVFDNNSGDEILHQVEVGNIEEELEKLGKVDLFDEVVSTWDIGYFSGDNKEEFTLNVG